MKNDYAYKVGDVIILTVDKPCTYSYGSEYNETWPKGKKLTITTVYHDGDVYAKDEHGVSRMVRKEEFDIITIDLKSIEIGNITIHDNVNGELITRHYNRVKKEEAKKKEEEEKKRDEYQEKYGTRYPSYRQLHPEEFPETVNPYDYGYIKFYEWSNIFGKEKLFKSKKEFNDFLSESKIEVSEEDKKVIRDNVSLYGICAKGTSILILSNSYESLKKAFEEFSTKKDAFILTKNDNAYTYLRTVTYDKEGHLSGFTFGNKRDEACVFDTKQKAEEAAEHVKERTANFIKLNVQSIRV